MSYSSLLFPCLSISMYPSISVLPNSSIRVETGDHSVPKFYVCTWTLPGPWAIIGVKTKTNLKDPFREQTFAALSSAAMRLHFYYDDTLWRVIKGKKKVLPSYLLLCQHQFSNSEFLNTDYCINNSLLHMIYTLSLPFPFITEQNMFPAFFFLRQTTFLMTRVQKSSDPFRAWTNLRTLSYF